MFLFFSHLLFSNKTEVIYLQIMYYAGSNSFTLWDPVRYSYKSHNDIKELFQIIVTFFLKLLTLQFFTIANQAFSLTLLTETFSLALKAYLTQNLHY